MSSRDIVARDDNSISDVMKLRFAPFVASEAKGIVMKDPEGREYLDFSGSWGVMNIGYGDERIIDTVHKQMEKLQFTPTISAFNEESVALAEKLISMTPGDFAKKVWFGHSGSDANEFLAKMIPIATGRNKIITFVGSYHGQTMGSYGMSGHPALGTFTAGANVIKLPYPYCYRCPFERDHSKCDLFCARYIEEYIFKAVQQPDQIGAVVIEAIQCDGGDVVPATGFIKKLEKICREYGILLIFDEVKTGFGHTGKMFGFEYEDVTPDAVVLGKAMGCGQPLSGIVGRQELMDAGTGMHLFTTAGNPVACASSLKMIDILEQDDLCSKAVTKGDYLRRKLEKLMEKYDIIGDIRGRGLVNGVELVKNCEDKEPDATAATLIVYRAYELGLILYYAGLYSNVLELTPPLTVSDSQIDQAVSIIEQSVSDYIEGRIDRNAAAKFAGWSV